MSAEQSGLLLHDVIVAIEGNPRASMSDLRERLSRMQAGETLHLSVISRGLRKKLGVPILEQTDRRMAWQSPGSVDLKNLGYEEALRQLVESELQSLEVRADLEEARNDMLEAQYEIEAAHAEVQSELARLQRHSNQERSAEASASAEIEALRRYEELLARENESRQLLAAREAEERALQAQAQKLEAELRALEAARFLESGKTTSLIYPEVAWSPVDDPREPDRTEARFNQVERRVEELHERFDRLEQLLDRALSDSE
jgi:DNA repair exonuclease SbcCD ATPase subunit